MYKKIGAFLVSIGCLRSITAGQIDVQKRTLVPLIKSVEIASARIVSTEALRLGGSTVTGGLEATAAVILNAPAGSNGVGINLASSNASIARVPAAVFVAAGSIRETFAILSSPVAASESVTITASRSVPGDSKSVSLTVIPTALIGLTLDATSVLGGTPVAGHVRFTGPPPASPAVTANLSCSDPTAATVPFSISLAQGRTVADFTVQTKGVSDPKSVTISASYAGKDQSAALKIQEVQLKQIGNTCANGTVCSFGFMAPPPVVLPVFLTSVAPQGGVTVNLTTNNAQKFPVPASVTIPAGQDHAPVSVNFPANATTGDATITASFKGITKSVSFSLVPPDITVSLVQFVDRFNNVITRAADSQPFSMCATVHRSAAIGDSNLTLWLSYMKHGTGTTSTGREFELPAPFSGAYSYDARVCTQLPGLEPGESYDVNVKADSRNVVEESREDNNTFHATIGR